MSQSGLIVDTEQLNPQIPTMFVSNDGTAVPIANTLELLGEVVPADAIPFRSVASGNTITYQIQYASAQPMSDPTAAGLPSFNSDQFIVDANGFVSIIGGPGEGTVTEFNFTDANGFVGVVTNASTTPTLVLSISVTDTHVLYSKSSGLAGEAAFAYDDSTNILSVPNIVSTALVANSLTGNASQDLTINAVGSQDLHLQTNTTDRLVIDSDGAWLLGGSPGIANFVLTSNGTGNPPTWEPSVAGYSPAAITVSPNAGEGDYTTISAALSAATSGQTIFVKEGTYTEDLALVPGVNISALGGQESQSNVIVQGKCSLSSAGNVVIYGIELQTDGDYLLEVTGSVGSRVHLIQCFLNALDHTAIHYTSSAGTSLISLENCSGDTATTGIAYFTHAGSGILSVQGGYYDNSGISSTTSTVVSGALEFLNVDFFDGSITTSGSGFFTNDFSYIIGDITINGTSGNDAMNSGFVGSGSDTSIIIGSGATFSLANSVISSSNTDAISGAGTLREAATAFINSAGISVGSYINLPVSAPNVLGKYTLPEIDGSAGAQIQTNGAGVVTWEVPPPGMVSPFTGDFQFHGNDLSIRFARAGNGIQFEAENLEAGDVLSSAVIGVLSQAGSGDAFYYCNAGGGTTSSWSFGGRAGISNWQMYAQDNNTGPNMQGNLVMDVTNTGAFNYPLQPACGASVTTPSANATGSGAQYNATGYDTPGFDIGGHFNPITGIYTIPNTGLYYLRIRAAIGNVTALMSGGQIGFRLNGSNSTNESINNPGSGKDAANLYTTSLEGIFQFTAGDTVQVYLIVTGGVGDTASVVQIDFQIRLEQ